MPASSAVSEGSLTKEEPEPAVCGGGQRSGVAGERGEGSERRQW